MNIESVFKDKVCVITGAGSGIGRALAVQLDAWGAHLALSDISQDGLEETLTLLGSERRNSVLKDIFDLANAADIEAYAPKVEAALGPADYVFNVAGLARVGSFDDSPLSSLETVMNVNFYGVVRMSKAFLGQLKQTRGGLVNISSIFGIIGFPGQADYCASKFAVRGFSETLAQEVEAFGVTVSCVHPGGVATNIARHALADVAPPDGKSRSDMDASFDKAAITPVKDAAHIILAGTARRKRRIIVGKDAKLVQLAARLFPVTYPKIMRKLQPDAFDIL